MLAALATLAFAATLWLIFVLLAGMLEESGPRIVAAAQAEILAAAAVPSSLRVTPLARTGLRQPSPERSRRRAVA